MVLSCYWHYHAKPSCGPVEFWWELSPDDRHRTAGDWLALCARCCMVMRKHDVEAARITNTIPIGVLISYGEGPVRFGEPQ
jgi:hypothetical protein